MNTFNDTTGTTVQLFEPAADSIYSIETVSHITQTPRHLIAVYCRHGLIVPVAPPAEEGWWFDDEAVRSLRQISRLRAEYGVNLHGVRRLANLIEEVERLRAEIRFLRAKRPRLQSHGRGTANI
jgi:DNA-binding transcriptional MerR regulator